MVCFIFKQALWLHRRFLSLCWMKQLVAHVNDVSCNNEQKISISNDFGFFIGNELQLLHSCSSVPNNDFEDFKAQATFSASYMLWLTKVLYFVLFSVPFCLFGWYLIFPLCASAKL